jgi:hypothetical protein
MMSFAGIAELVRVERQISQLPYPRREKGRMRGLE